MKDVLITGVRTYRDDHRGTERGRNVAFIVELDGVHVIHLGDIGHLLTEDKLTDIGPVDVACIPVGGTLSATKAAELVAQLDVKVVVPMPVCDDDDSVEALAKFLHEMGVPARSGAAVEAGSRCRRRSRPKSRPSSWSSAGKV